MFPHALIPSVALSLLAVGCAHARTVADASSMPVAQAALVNASGGAVGIATLYQEAGGVRVELSLTGLSDGAHGVHLHAVGACDGPAFTSAGAHINSSGAMHGVKNSAGPHAGDLPNVIMNGGQSVRYTTTTRRVTFSDAADGLFDANGSAIVVHAAADDDSTDPAGNSGARIACGVITRR